MDSDDLPPIDGDDLNDLERHLTRRPYAAYLVHRADTKATITLAERARSRIVVQPQIGMMVY